MLVLPSSTLSPRKSAPPGPLVLFRQEKRQRPPREEIQAVHLATGAIQRAPFPAFIIKDASASSLPSPKPHYHRIFPGSSPPPPPPQQQQSGPRAEPLLPLAMGPGLYSDIGKKARGQNKLLFHSVFFGRFLDSSDFAAMDHRRILVCAFSEGSCWISDVVVCWIRRSPEQGLPYGPEVYPDHLHLERNREYLVSSRSYWFLVRFLHATIVGVVVVSKVLSWI